MNEALRHIDYYQFNETVLHLIAVVFVLLMVILMLRLPRRAAILPMIAIALFTTNLQRIVVSGFDFNMLRIAILVGMIRIFVRSEYASVQLNAIDKAIYFNKIYNIATIADDSGLMVDYLNGAPGILSARFAGPGGDDKARIKKLLQLLKGVNLDKRGAHFHCAIAFADDGKINKLIEEEVKGCILEKMRGKSGFGYDPVFYYPPLQKSFADFDWI